MNVRMQPPCRAGSVDFVNGHTRLYGILGHPIEQVRSPQTVTFELRRRNINAILLPLHVRPQDFDEVFPRLLKLANLDGLVVTVPHKTAIPRHLQRLGPLAQVSGGVSVIARSLDDIWVGEMFDGLGCVASILRRRVPLEGRRIQLLGAGGAGSAIAAALVRQGPARLAIQDPDEARCAHLLARLAAAFPNMALASGLAAIEEIDVLVNASPVGMLDADQMPIQATRFPSGLVVMDAIMDPDCTKLLRVAEESGCVTIYGREMLDAQISAVCDFLLNARQTPADLIEIRH